MLKPIVIALLSFLLPFSSVSLNLFNGNSKAEAKANTGTQEKMIVANGNVAMNLDLNKLNGTAPSAKGSSSTELRFSAERNSFFTVIVFEDELRGPMPSSMAINPQNFATLPAKLNASYQSLVVESMPYGEQYELTVRDGKTGFTFFNIEGHLYDFEPDQDVLKIQTGRMLISREFANALGRSADAGKIVGEITITANMRPIEVSEIVGGEIESGYLPANSENRLDGTVPGPDVIVGDVYGLAQFGGSDGTYVGLAVGTNSCNFGTEDLNWFRLPSNDHPVIPQNMYRMSGGSSNNERFEQIGQSNVKHAFTALTGNICGLGCNGVGGSRIGSGCSDPYSASLNAGPNIGSRAWINPFDGVFPRGDSSTDPNTHSGHSHQGPSHKMLTEINDLRTSTNAGATYYAEGQYITPHEYQWCQANPGQCNMYNNVSYRQYNVSGDGSPFSFSPVAPTQRTDAAIKAWTGATFETIEPAPGVDGIGTVAYKVTNPSPGVWHYEYAVYNQNLDRAIQSFSVPTGNGVTLSNIGFHAPPQQPGWANDGTMGDQGFSSATWSENQLSGSVAWSSESFALNQNANAIRWGTMYNFRFDSNRPPQTRDATIGFYKTGNPITVQVQAPMAVSAANVSVSGRVMTSTSRGVSRAYVTMTDSTGGMRTAVTNMFGFYKFDDVAGGATYTVSVSTKRYSFTPQTLQINDNLENLNFVAAP